MAIKKHTADPSKDRATLVVIPIVVVDSAAACSESSHRVLLLMSFCVGVIVIGVVTVMVDNPTFLFNQSNRQ
jgi:hypothetical protein